MYRQRAVELWGRLDIVVNNAYPTGGHPTLELWGEATDIEEEAWDVGFDIGDLPAAAGISPSFRHPPAGIHYAKRPLTVNLLNF